MRPATIVDPTRRRRWWAAGIGALSCLATVGAGAAQLRYAFTPGELGEPALAWPEHSGITRVPGRATLLMFVHPRCTCTRASLDELAEVIALDPPAADVVLVVDDEDHGPLAPAVALDVPGARIVHEHGEETERFGVATSGEVMLFSAGGERRFVGGITASRGARGSSPGRVALEAALTDPHRATDAAVYGCPLTESAP